MTTDRMHVPDARAEQRSGQDGERPVHLVLKPDWPRALCGAIVTSHLGTGAPGRDRCTECLRIAADRGLGRPGWQAGGSFPADPHG